MDDRSRWQAGHQGRARRAGFAGPVEGRTVKKYGRQIFFDLSRELEEGKTRDWLVEEISAYGLSAETSCELAEDLRFFGVLRREDDLWKLTSFGRRVAAKITAITNWKKTADA